MAKNYIPMKVTFRKNFDFGKLSRGMNKVIEETLQKIGKKSVEISRDNIDKGLKPKLKPFTLKMRKKGKGWNNKNVGKPVSNKPLKQTGKVYKSMKYNKSKNTMELLDYGLIQQIGFTSILKKRARGYAHRKIHGKGVGGISQEKPSVKYINVPPRPFIANPTQKRHNKELVKIKKNHMARTQLALKTKTKLLASGATEI